MSANNTRVADGDATPRGECATCAADCTSLILRARSTFKAPLGVPIFPRTTNTPCVLCTPRILCTCCAGWASGRRGRARWIGPMVVAPVCVARTVAGTASNRCRSREISGNSRTGCPLEDRMAGSGDWTAESGVFRSIAAAAPFAASSAVPCADSVRKSI